MELSVIAPTYNESENVEALIEALGNSLRGIDYEILISDDDSPDLTWAGVEAIAKRDCRVRVLRRMSNRGLGHSVIDGFVCARGEVVACIDADLQHDASILPRMLMALRGGSDLVIGSRHIPGGSTGEWSWVRRLGSWGATQMARVLLGVDLRDPMSGYFMLRRHDFLRVRRDLDGAGFKILLELAAKLKTRSIREVPYTFRPRTAGQSKLSGKIVAAYLQQLWRLSFLGRIIPTKFAKFAIVGATGVVVNLTVMAAMLAFSSYRDWRASAVASLAATVSNYLLNNFWTFRDRPHRGTTLLSRYAYYLFSSLVGLGATTASYVAITLASGRTLGLTAITHKWMFLLYQLLAILVGVFFNYKLNRTITWPRDELCETRLFLTPLDTTEEKTT